MRVKKLIRITMLTVLSLKRIEAFIKSQISMNDIIKEVLSIILPTFRFHSCGILKNNELYSNNPTWGIKWNHLNLWEASTVPISYTMSKYVLTRNGCQRLLKIRVLYNNVLLISYTAQQKRIELPAAKL